MRSVIVIGGGPAGMAAALAASRAGAAVTLLEKNEKLGKKLYITGKGRCNVTNSAAPLEDFLKNVPQNPRFLYSAMAALNAAGLRALLEDYGTPTVEERGGRVFPASGKASDVTRAFSRALDEAGVRVRLNAAVKALHMAEGRVGGVVTADGNVIEADAVIVATGGGSYPATGSTGDGWRFAAEAGLSVEPPLPSLVGIVTAESWPRELQGITLKNVKLRASRAGKRFFAQIGEVLFTHFGVSGPLVLTLSSHLSGKPLNEVSAHIDLKPGMTDEEVAARLLREMTESPRKAMATLMEGWLPKRMAGPFVRAAGLPENIAAHEVTRPQRVAVQEAMKNLPITPAALRPLAEAVITRGGVSVKSLRSSSMGARDVEGLYFAGEVLDVDALTGGFNLQIAFSTGYLAGTAAAAGEG